MTKFEEELMATAKMIPTSDGNEIKFKTSSALYDYLLLSNGEAELYLESQLQQQALPVVPEDVAKLPPFDDMKEYVLDERLLTIREYLNKLDDKSNSDITEAEAWCLIHEDIAYRAMIDGYTVEKPQLFYLKHIDFCKTDKHYDGLQLNILMDH